MQLPPVRKLPSVLPSTARPEIAPQHSELISVGRPRAMFSASGTPEIVHKRPRVASRRFMKMTVYVHVCESVCGTSCCLLTGQVGFKKKSLKLCIRRGLNLEPSTPVTHRSPRFAFTKMTLGLGWVVESGGLPA